MKGPLQKCDWLNEKSICVCLVAYLIGVKHFLKILTHTILFVVYNFFLWNRNSSLVLLTTTNPKLLQSPFNFFYQI